MRTIILQGQKEEELLRILERAHYEVTGRENIVNFMAINNMTDQEVYKNYWNEYLQYLKAYNKIKNTFTDIIVKPMLQEEESSKNWHVDFDKKELVIYES